MRDQQPLLAPCRQCGVSVEILPVLAKLTNEFGTYCPACAEALNRQQDHERHTRKVTRSFTRLCPPCFPDTERKRLPCQVRTEVALRWQWGIKGLNLWGVPGTGKTRTMSLVLERELHAGRTIIALGPDSFRAQCESREYQRARWLRQLSLVDILFFDDFDKQNLTRGMEKDLFGVLNNRMGRRPVMTTGNTPGAVLEKQFSLGGPMVDRIRRYCVNVHFGKEDVGL